MVRCFVAGLKEEIQLGVQMFRPISLTAGTNLARLQEEKNLASRKSPRAKNIKTGLPFNINTSSGRNQTPPIKRSTPSEMKERKVKGPCYNCDEKFAPGHHCKTQRLYLLDGTQIEPGDITQENELQEDELENPIVTETGDFP